MGHSDIGVTLNTYTHLRLEDAQLGYNYVYLVDLDIRCGLTEAEFISGLKCVLVTECCTV